MKLGVANAKSYGNVTPMPRQARIDAPGAFHHIICRGLERRKIFWDDTDRDNFLSRLGDILQKSSTRCYAWALIPNHFHLLLQTGMTPLATVMRRLLTGYAVVFNHRHNRSGHLFQNRYKSILCQMEPYLLELVRYIHLNPIRAGIITSMQELQSYRYCGHGRLLGAGVAPWQSTQEVLERFGSEPKVACRKYDAFVADGLAFGNRPEFTGGGLVRSAGGWQEILSARRAGAFIKSDERILGDSDFVEAVLNAAKEQIERETACHMEGVDLEQVAQRVAEVLHVSVAEVWKHGKWPIAVQARSLLCYWAIREVGITATTLGAGLGITQSAVSRSAVRGERLTAKKGWQLK